MKISAELREKMLLAISAGAVLAGPALAQESANKAEVLKQKQPGSAQVKDNYSFHQGSKVEAQHTEVNLKINQMDRIGKIPSSVQKGPETAPHLFQYNIDLSSASTKSTKSVLLPACDGNSSKLISPSVSVTSPPKAVQQKSKLDNCVECGRG